MRCSCQKHENDELIEEVDSMTIRSGPAISVARRVATRSSSRGRAHNYSDPTDTDARGGVYVTCPNYPVA